MTARHRTYPSTGADPATVQRPWPLWLVPVAAALHLALWQVSEPPVLFSDFYKANWTALERLAENGWKPLFPFTDVGNWSNLPIIAWLFAPLALFGEITAGWVFLALGYAAVAGALLLLLRLVRPEAALGADLGAMLLCLFLLNGPLLNSLREGNSTHMLLLALVLSVRAWQQGRPFRAGLLMGVCATFKLPLLLLGVYFLFRREWRVVAGGLATMLGAVALSFAVHGWGDHVAWYRDFVAPFLGAFLGAFNLQSVNGFVIRLTAGAEFLYSWETLQPVVWQRFLQVALLAGLYGASAAALWRAGRRDRQRAESPPGRRGLTELSLVLVLALASSPVSWTHYYLFLLLPIGLALGGRLALPGDRGTRRLLWAGIALISLPVVMPYIGVGPIAQIVARTVYSAWLFGGVCLWAAFVRALWTMPRGDAPLPHAEA